ncbi:MAG: hypothetical protein ACFB50_02325 [Rubrobacteraceae bacterium]
MTDSMAEVLPDGESWLDGQTVFVRHLIVRHDNHRFSLLTIPTEEGDSLPVFSSELAARAFLRFSRCGEGWHVRETTAGELISLLMGHAAELDLITLDPPSTASREDTAGADPVDKRDFIGTLMRQPILLSAK